LHLVSSNPQGAKSASAKAASKIAGEDEDSAEADAKAIADAKETPRGGGAAAKVRYLLILSFRNTALRREVRGYSGVF
jgi:hypothetical protein